MREAPTLETGEPRRLVVFQSLWSMERRHTDGVEPSLEENVARIAAAGFDGISAHWYDREAVGRTAACLSGTGLAVEGMCFPKTIDALKPALEVCAEHGVHHLNLQPDVRVRKLGDAVRLVEGWMALAAEVDFPVYIETHRDRLTTDLFFTLDLLDAVPDMPLLADLSHFLVGREFAYPVSDEDHALIHRILDASWAFHGRIGSREQVQIEISFPHHAIWVELFRDWWRYGFDSWRRRAAPSATLGFTCELGPKPYAITGRDGNDTTDRWEESVQLMEMARSLWREGASGN